MSNRSAVRELLIMTVVIGGLLVLFCGSCGGVIYLVATNFEGALADLVEGSSGSVMDLQKQDYAEARKSFQTRLTKKGASWQPYDPTPPLPGVKEIVYASGPLKLKAWINPPPPGRQPQPAVLYLHGGFAFDLEDWEQCQPFRDAGFITMVPILRGENGQPGHYTWFYDEVDDVLAAAEALAKQPGVDPQRIYISGHSAGGTLALLAAMSSKRFRAAASFSATPDQAALAKAQPKIVPFDKNNARELQMRSPLAYARSFKCPVRMYFGNEEAGTLRAPSQRTAQRAKEAGLDVNSSSVMGDHKSSVPPAMKQAIDFFNSK